MAARWALVRNYHQAKFIRDGVSPGELTRYGLDILVTRPEGVEKAEFEFIFDMTAMNEDGGIDAFGEAVVAAVRDDPRLQDPLTLGGIMQQLIFAPGACDAILPAMTAVGNRPGRRRRMRRGRQAGADRLCQVRRSRRRRGEGPRGSRPRNWRGWTPRRRSIAYPFG